MIPRLAYPALLVALIATGLSGFSARAQPVPALNSLSPEWIRRGTATEVTLSGQNFGVVTGLVINGDPGVTGVFISAPGNALTVETPGGGIAVKTARPDPNTTRLVRLTVAPETALGARELRVVGPGGISAALKVTVSALAELAETAGNNSLDSAQRVVLPTAIRGAITGGAETDFYRFNARAGQTFVFEVLAARNGSPLDSSLAVLDSQSRELARNEDTYGFDSFLAFRAPADGDYVVSVRDLQFRGGGDYRYRLLAGELPEVETVFPLGGQRGKSVEIAITGQNLGGTEKVTLSIDAASPLGRRELRVNLPGGLSNPFGFDVQDLPDVLETEPNNSLIQTNFITPPLVINGRISPPRDVDRFRFRPAADQRLVCEVAAQALGSKLDALLLLTDTNGALLAANDDAAGADARIEFDFKKDMDYVLAIRDLTERGGDRFGYRLSVKPPSATGPGFTGRVIGDVLRLNRGGRAKARVEVTRFGGFAGPVRVNASDLPPGIEAEPLVIPADASAGQMEFRATSEAPTGTRPLRLQATATIGNAPVTISVAPADGADRGVRAGYLTVLDTAPFTVDVTTLAAVVDKESATTLDVLIERRSGFTNDIKLSADGFSLGRDPITKSFDVPETIVKNGQPGTKLTLKAKLDAEIGLRSIWITGTAAADGGSSLQLSRPVPVTVNELPMLLTVSAPRVRLTIPPPGVTNSTSAEAEFRVKIERRAGFAAEVPLVFKDLPAGVRITPEQVPAGAPDALVKITASANAKPTTNQTVTVQGTATFNDRIYRRTASFKLELAPPEVVVMATNVAAKAP